MALDHQGAGGRWQHIFSKAQDPSHLRNEGPVALSPPSAPLQGLWVGAGGGTRLGAPGAGCPGCPQHTLQGPLIPSPKPGREPPDPGRGEGERWDWGLGGREGALRAGPTALPGCSAAGVKGCVIGPPWAVAGLGAPSYVPALCPSPVSTPLPPLGV